MFSTLDKDNTLCCHLILSFISPNWVSVYTRGLTLGVSELFNMAYFYITMNLYILLISTSKVGISLMNFSPLAIIF